ncbi:MAG TPA: NAD(P)-binding domain-containing protein [Flavobacteriales bacterium]|nr:NAD(P)-binding domain-containing protein [Flavobacteriales bacterium]HPH83618.1 NAD(P)-binding domain-containing protein [Flavobacteriales bacterium]
MSDQPSAHMPSVAVIGAGSWATAIVKILNERPIHVHWWMRSEEQVQHIAQFSHNPRYLSDIQLDMNKVHPSSDLSAVIAGSEMIILALPAAFVHQTLSGLSKDAFHGKSVFSAIKGMIPERHENITDYLHTSIGIHPKQMGIIAGPCHSEEVAMERQSYLTVSAVDEELALRMAHILNCRFIHTHTILNDVQGIEYATVMKNIISLAVGITRGMNYGDNFQAVLVSNAMQEMKRFLDAAVPNANRDLNESAYLGDLLVTAYSQFSRNRIFGQMIGKGYTVKSAQLEMNMIAEGFYAVHSLNEVNKSLGVDLPICDFVHRILYEGGSPSREIRVLEAKLK